MAIRDLIAQAEEAGTPLEAVGDDEQVALDTDDMGVEDVVDEGLVTDDDDLLGDDEAEGDGDEDGEEAPVEDDADDDPKYAGKSRAEIIAMHQSAEGMVGRATDPNAQQERIASIIGLEADGEDIMDVARGVPIAEKVMPRTQQVYGALWTQEINRRANETGETLEEAHAALLSDPARQSELATQATMSAQQEFLERGLSAMARTFARINGMPAVQQLVSTTLQKHGIRVHADKIAAMADPLKIDEMQKNGQHAEIENIIVTLGKSLAFDEAMARRSAKGKGKPTTAPVPRDGTRGASGGATGAPVSGAVRQRAGEIAKRGGVMKYLDKNDLRQAAEAELRAEGKLR